jgi:hypothetical protein
MGNHHSWKFFRAGGFDQVRLDTAADLQALEELDQKLWVALACPTTGLEFDSKTLALIDTDKDGRIRAPELIAAVKWACACLKNPQDLFKSASDLPLDSINDAQPEGKQLLASARHILSSLGRKEATVITLEDTTDTAKIFAQTQFNGDGIVPTESAADDATKAVINDIIACLGAETDRSGKPGISQAKADLFFAEAQAYSDWWKKAETDSTILPLDGSTPAAAAAFKAIKPKIDDYFTRCRLAAFDPRALNALNREEKEYAVFAGKDLSLASTEIAGFPLAQVGPAKPLPLSEGVNPAWADAMSKFATEVVKPILNGKAVITESDWSAISAKFASYDAWLVAKAGATVEKLGVKRVREILAGKGKETVAALIAQDKALEPESNAISAVERLVRYHRDLNKLVHNFVSFRDFYRRKEKAIFQAGTLYLDQRSCDLCLTVEDAGKHAIMAGLAGAYLAYCECARKGTNEKMQIVAAFTNGDSDNLMVGRNGIFYDRKGRDWDATISKIVDNPISIRQAFWSPYKKAARMIQEQIAKRAAAADDAATTRLAQAEANIEKAAQTSQPQAPDPAKQKIDPGLVAALSVGAAGLGATFGAIVTGFLNLKAMMPLGVVAILLIISGPSMLMAWLKLRRRNLGPILDANGWAVNAKARINVPFGASLTGVAALPPGHQRDMLDPFAEKKRPWKLYWTLFIILVLALLWVFGKLDGLLPDKISSASVLRGKQSSAVMAPATPTSPAAPATPAAPAMPAAPATPAAPKTGAASPGATPPAAEQAK